MKLSPITFFIVPGFKQKATAKYFSWLVDFLTKKGMNVVPVPIKWNHKVMSDYIDDFRRCYQKHKTKVNYVLGFSYGSIVILSSANELQPNKIFLCSLSPEFKEDIPLMKPWLKKYVGEKRLNDSRSRSGRQIAQELKVPAVIFYGEIEGKRYPDLKVRSEETARLAKKSKLVIVSNAPHKIDFPEYIDVVKNELEAI